MICLETAAETSSVESPRSQSPVESPPSETPDSPTTPPTADDANDNDMELPNSDWTGFKIVGDNVDKTIKPTYQRHDHRGK